MSDVVARATRNRRIVAGRTALLAASLTLALAPWGCDDGNRGGAGGAGTSSSAIQSSSSGESCLNMLVENYCGLCLEVHCCAELSDCDTACLHCLESTADPTACAANASHSALFACENAQCADKCLADFGETCTNDDDCTSHSCLPSKICTKTCTGPDDCPPAPEWTCDGASAVCTCEASGPEACNGRDDDCDGVVDDDAPCPTSQECVDGACSCRFAICDGDCVNLDADHDHCGTCEKVCGDTQTCCGASCTDIQTDTFNCGTCGHDCDGGTCAAGVCEPILLASDPIASNARAIALSATYVYYAHEGGVGRVLKTGGLLEPLWSGSSIPRAMALTSTKIYWTSELPGTLLSLPLIGGQPPQPLASGFGMIGLAIDGATAYFVDWGGGQVASIPIAGGTKTVLATDAPNNMFHCVVSDDEVFYTTYDTVTVVPTTGGFPTALVAGQFNAYAIAVDATNVYWSDDDGIYVIPKFGGLAMLLSAETGVRAIATDATRVYWTSQLGTIKSAPIAGGTVETLVSGQSSPEGIALDANSVYWTNYADATVWKVAK